VKRGSTWRVPAALIAMSVIPLLGGAARLTQLLGGPAALATDVRFSRSPVPLVVHIVATGIYALLGAVQFSPGWRRRWPRWHRVAGRILIAAGTTVALTAVWMTLRYPFKPGTGELLFVVRLAVGWALASSIVLGFVAIRRGHVAAHRAWMIRAYALALGAATQAFTLGVGQRILGRSVLIHDSLMTAGWVLNPAVAERLIRGRAWRSLQTRHAGPAVTAPSSTAVSAG
jgi:uncharacterized membrane protein